MGGEKQKVDIALLGGIYIDSLPPTNYILSNHNIILNGPVRFLLKQLFSFILPVTMLIIVPRTIENRWTVEYDPMFFIGICVGAIGLLFLASTIALFIGIGKGTLAPWSPAQRLIIRGPYAYVRNPMITGVLSVLLAESLVVHSTPIFLWFIAFFIINNIYFTLSEEPGLEKRFGEEYHTYKQNVPRWIPRLTPWTPNGKEKVL